MKYLFISTIVLTILCPSCRQKSSGEKLKPVKVWRMQHGIALIEAESVVEGNAVPGYWEMVPDSIKGDTGRSAFMWMGSGNLYRDPLVKDAPGTSGPFLLRYRVFVPDEGDYTLKIRNYHWREDGDNDLWVSFNNMLFQKLWDHHADEWTWSEAISNINNYQGYPLKRGINIIDIAGRSKFFTIDRLALIRMDVSEDRWADPALPESELMSDNSDQWKEYGFPCEVMISDTGITTARISCETLETEDQFLGFQVSINDEWLEDITHMPDFRLNDLPENSSCRIRVRTVSFDGSFTAYSEPVEFRTIGFPPDGIFFRPIPQSPLIDGKKDVIWDDVDPLRLRINPSGSYHDDLGAVIRMAFDAEKFYALMQVTDDHPDTTEGSRDGIEIYFDPDNSKDPFWSYADRIYRFSLRHPMKNGKHHVSTALIERDLYVEGLAEARQVVTDGYVIELALPWTTLGMKAPENASLMGLNIRIRDTDGEDEPERSLFLFGGSMESILDPFSLGTVKLDPQ